MNSQNNRTVSNIRSNTLSLSQFANIAHKQKKDFYTHRTRAYILILVSLEHSNIRDGSRIQEISRNARTLFKR